MNLCQIDGLYTAGYFVGLAPAVIAARDEHHGYYDIKWPQELMLRRAGNGSVSGLTACQPSRRLNPR
jgi:hypothetical protein